MKKIFVVALLIFNFVIFAETGYTGTEWYTPKNIVIKSLLLSPVGNGDNAFIYIKEKNILNERTVVCYYFSAPDDLSKAEDFSIDELFQLTGIGYLIPKEKTELLLKKYNIQVSKLFIKNMKKNLNTLVNKVIIEDKENKINIDKLDLQKAFLCYVSLGFEKDGIASDEDFQIVEKPDANTGTIYIYDYNDDTRVYIYENVIEDKTFVVYVPHEQDY